MIINKDEKFETVYLKSKDKPSEQTMFNDFLKEFPDDWKQLKISFSKFKRSNQFGKTIPLPKPEQSLRKEIRIWLQRRNT